MYNIINMNLFSFGIIGLILLFSASCCSTTFDFGHSDCTFNVSYSDNTCLSFAFDYCTWKEKVEDANGQHIYSTQTSSDWKSCTQRCCDASLTYPQNPDSIVMCQDYLDDKFLRKLLIPIFVNVGVIACLLITCCACCTERCAPCR